MEMKLLCATILDAVIRFYEEPENMAAFEKWQAGKGEKLFEPGNREQTPGTLSHSYTS